MTRRSLLNREVVFKAVDIMDQFEDFQPENPFTEYLGLVVEDNPRHDILKIKLYKPISYIIKGKHNSNMHLSYSKVIPEVCLSSAEVEVLKPVSERSKL